MTHPLSCEQCEEWLPGYVLHALTPEEAVATAAHVQTCARCQTRLAVYEDTVGRLGEAVTLHEPPADLQHHLMTTVRSDLAPTRVTLRETRPRWWQIRLPRWALALTVANAVLLAGMAWFTWQAWSRLRHERQQVVQTLDLQRQTLAVLTEPTRRLVVLGNGGRARGTLLIQAAARKAVLIVQDLPPLPPNRVYQLWLIRDGIRDNGGTFRVDDHGFGTHLIRAPYPLDIYTATGITEEPVGGSPGPTSPRLIGSKL